MLAQMFGSLAHCGMLELFQPIRPIMRIDPVSVVRFLVEQQNLTQRDLIPQFGSESAVSMFMTGQRNLTLGQVRKLSARFKLPTDVLHPKRPLRTAQSDPRKRALVLDKFQSGYWSVNRRSASFH